MAEINRNRILVFDQDLDWAQAVKEVFSGHNYEVDVFTQDFRDCLEQARRKLYVVGIVNIDVVEGFSKELPEFCRLLPSTALVIVQDEGDPACWRLWQEQGLDMPSFFGRKAYITITDLVPFVQDIINKLGMKGDNFRVHLPEDIGDQLAAYGANWRSLPGLSRLDQSSVKVIEDELRFIISQMFAPKNGEDPIATQVDVGYYDNAEGRSGSALYQLSPEVVLQRGPRKSALLKFGPKEEIKQEARNYDRFVEWFLRRTQTVRKIADAQGNHFAGILYSFPTDDPTSSRLFSRFVTEEDLERSLAVIRKMFSPENKQWLAVEGNAYLGRDQTRFQTYYFSQVLRCTPYQLRRDYYQRLCKELDNIEARVGSDIFTDHGGTFTLSIIDRQVLNPVRFLMEHPCVDQVKMTVVHGDLHANNILIEPGDRGDAYYFIDFKYTGFGHVYRDFIELELSLRYDLFCSKSLPDECRLTGLDSSCLNSDGLKKLMRLERCLIKRNVKKEPVQDPILDPESESFDPHLHKAYALISEIRDLALANWPSDARHYYLGLVASALKALKYSYPLDVRVHRLMLAGTYANLILTGAIS